MPKKRGRGGQAYGKSASGGANKGLAMLGFMPNSIKGGVQMDEYGELYDTGEPLQMERPGFVKNLLTRGQAGLQANAFNADIAQTGFENELRRGTLGYENRLALERAKEQAALDTARDAAQNAFKQAQAEREAGYGRTAAQEANEWRQELERLSNDLTMGRMAKTDQYARQQAILESGLRGGLQTQAENAAVRLGRSNKAADLGLLSDVGMQTYIDKVQPIVQSNLQHTATIAGNRLRPVAALGDNPAYQQALQGQEMARTAKDAADLNQTLAQTSLIGRQTQAPVVLNAGQMSIPFRETLDSTIKVPSFSMGGEGEMAFGGTSPQMGSAPYQRYSPGGDERITFSKKNTDGSLKKKKKDEDDPFGMDTSMFLDQDPAITEELLRSLR